jgi:hypothetical protein
MVNKSKSRDLRMWEIWGGSGAVGTYSGAVLRELEKEEKKKGESGGRAALENYETNRESYSNK